MPSEEPPSLPQKSERHQEIPETPKTRNPGVPETPEQKLVLRRPEQPCWGDESGLEREGGMRCGEAAYDVTLFLFFFFTSLSSSHTTHFC